MIVWLAAVALASDSVQFAVEALPDAYGRSQQRALVELDIDERLDGMRFVARAGIRQWTAPEIGAAPRVLRLGVRWSAGDADLAVGRFGHLDARGVKRLDGVSADLDTPSGRSSLSAWGGRTWRPERGGGGTLLIGAEGRLHPERLGTSSTWLGGALGAELRGTDALRGRTWGAVTARSPRGDQVGVVVEVDPTQLAEGPTAWRAGADASVPISAAWTAIADLRWSGLRPHNVPDDELTPMDWVAPEGYGIADVGVAWQAGHGGFISVAPMVRPEIKGAATVGGSVQARVGLLDGDMPVQVFGRAAVVGASRLAGGGATVSGRAGELGWQATGAVWSWRGLDEIPAVIGEGRLMAQTPLGDSGVSLRGQLATGGDRVLARWMRGGVAIVAGSGEAR